MTSHVKTRFANITRLLTAGTAVFITPSAFGASLLADPAEIAALACNKIKEAEVDVGTPDISHDDTNWRAISGERVAYFMAASVGLEKTRAEAVKLVLDVSGDRHPPESNDIWDTVEQFQSDVLAGGIDGLKAFNRGGKLLKFGDKSETETWLVDRQVILRCALPEDQANTGTTAETEAKKKKPIKLRLRGNVDALSAVGKARKSADAASFGMSRELAYEADGTRKRTTTYAVNAALGVPLLGENQLQGLLGYASYELKQVRLRPKPILTPPATERDSDTDVLKMGLIGHKLIDISAGPAEYQTSVNFTLDNSYLIDFVKDSERYRARLAGSLYNYDGLLGLCGLGGYMDIPNSKIWTRCEFQAIADFNILTKAGNLTLTGKETFAHAGGRAAFKAYFGDSVDEGLFISAEYRHLERLRGNSAFVPNINNHTLSFGHRWWNHNRFALELKAELFDGVKDDSLNDINSLSFGLGLIF